MSSTSVGIPTLRVNEPSRDKELEEEREEEIDMMDQKDRRNYKPEVVEYVWELLKANVAHHQVPAVIKSSLKIFWQTRKFDSICRHCQQYGSVMPPCQSKAHGGDKCYGDCHGCCFPHVVEFVHKIG